MGTTRSSHVNRLRTHGIKIFGSDSFKDDWFATKYKRGTVPKLQDLSGAYMTTQGKKYQPLPLILFPDGPDNKKDIFLNPALIRVSWLLVFTTQHTNKVQTLKVVLFGPSSLQENARKTSGPKPAGIRWELREVTPGAIAFAAIMVSFFLAEILFVCVY